MILILLLGFLAVASGGPATESYKDQFCTDPRTMRKHAAYTEWADAYSCTRHRCQPGGRNLAIYTVGCKRVEAPESAIECEEVVEDTNMQFPFCCTRLRCLVVVRGEVWTRVLGQPWEALPAAPWSHMYKMKKPPPADGTFLPKTAEQGPVYELSEGDSGSNDKVLRATKLASTDAPDGNDNVPRSLPNPDIVIALSTGSENKGVKAIIDNTISRHKKVRKAMPAADQFLDEEQEREHADPEPQDGEQIAVSTDKPADTSDERYYNANAYGVTQKPPQAATWTDIPQNQWNEHDPGMETDANKDAAARAPAGGAGGAGGNLQALVDAIGSRMKDIEHVVQRMSEKVHRDVTGAPDDDRLPVPEEEPAHKRHKEDKEYGKTKRPGSDETYKRFSVRNRGSKYLHTTESTTEAPLFIEDAHLNGYFSDASNGMLRRTNGPKEPQQTYMAPVETRRKGGASLQEEALDDDKKHKKHQHKKKKGKHHKKHHTKKRFNRLTSAETDKNVVSLEDSNVVSS